MNNSDYGAWEKIREARASKKGNGNLATLLWYKDKYASDAVSLRIIIVRKTQFVEYLDNNGKVIDTRWCSGWDIPLDYNEVYPIEKIKNFYNGGQE